MIAWLKDLDGRYLHINRRYATDLNTTAERLYGRTDPELPARETVDGPRRQYADDGLEEPLQLEYSIPAFEARPTLTAIRFAVRAPDGQPVGICGVAAPVSEARLAHDEAARLMEIERGSRLGSAAARSEPLEKWEVGTEAAGATGVDSGPAWAQQLEDELEASRARAEQAEADAAHFRHDEVEGELEAARARAEQAEADAAHFRVEVEGELEAARARAEQAEADAAHLRVEVEGELEAARARAEQAEADAAHLRVEVEGELEAARARAEQAEADAAHFRDMAERASQELLAISSRAASNAEPELAGKLVDQVGQLQQELEQTRAELEQARAEGRAAHEEIGAELEQARAEARASQEEAHAELEQARAEGRAAQEEIGAELEQARAEVRATHEDLVAALSEREQAREEREQARTEAERSRLAAAEARTAAIAAQEELEAARIGHAQATAELTDRLRERDTRIGSLHAPAALVSGLSADLQRAIASERERGKELTRALDQLVARLADLEPGE